MAKVELTLEANVSKLKQQLGDVFDKKEARGIFKEFKAAFKEQERAAKKLASVNRKAAKEQKKLTNALEGTKNAAEAVGGKIGEMAGRFEKVGQAASKLGAALGPAAPVVAGVAALTLGAAAAAVAVGATVAALGHLVARADELIELNKDFQDVFDPVDPEGLAAIYEFNDALAAAEVTGRQLQILLAADVAPTMVKIADIVGRVTFELLENEKAWRAGVAVVDTFTMGAASALQGAASATKMLVDVTHKATEGMGQGYEGLKDRTVELREEQEAAAEASRKEAAAREAATRAAAAQREAMRAAAEAAREAAAAQREMMADVEAMAGAELQLSAIIERATADQLTASEALTLAYDKQVEAIQRAGLAGASYELQVEALSEASQRLERDLLSLSEAQEEAADPTHAEAWAEAWSEAVASVSPQMQQAATSVQALGASLSDTLLQFSEHRMSILEDEASAIREAAEVSSASYREAEAAKVDAALAAGRISEDVATAQLERIEATQTEEERTADARIAIMEREALKAFKINKATSIAAATVKAAETVIALMPAFAFLGPGAPIAAAAVATAALATQIAVIEAQEPPSFAAGGLVADRIDGDHTPILASPTEGIVSARGMSTLGRDGLEAVNAGRGMSTEVIVSLDRQIIAGAVADVLSSDRQVRAQVRAISGARTGQALPYGRGR